MTLTPQDIFTTVWNHLKQQGQPSRGEFFCQYRTPEGLSCAVGCLLDDDTAWDFDHRPGKQIGHISQADIPEALRPHIPLLAALQAAHDTDVLDLKRWSESWPRELRLIARDYNLEVPQ